MKLKIVKDPNQILRQKAVKIKDPFEYLKKIEFHSTIKNFNEYFI